MFENGFDITKSYNWSITKNMWINNGCSGCEFHIADTSPETTAFMFNLERELNVQ